MIFIDAYSLNSTSTILDDSLLEYVVLYVTGSAKILHARTCQYFKK